MPAKIIPIAKDAPQKRFTKAAENLLLNNRSGVYYVKKSFRRQKIPDLFESTRETKIGRAKSKALEMIQAHLNRYTGVEDKRTGHRLGAVIDEILRTVTPTKRKGTQENHGYYLGELRKEWAGYPVDRVTLPAWQTWLSDFKRKKKRKTYADYAKHMNLVLRYAYRMKYTKHLVTLPNPDPVKQDTGRVFTKEEIAALWAAMKDDTRDQFVLCFECFMRLREALYLTWDRVDLEHGVVTLRAEHVKTGSKTGKGRAFTLSPHALERMRARRARVRSKFVFPSPENPDKPIHQNKTAWITAKKKAGIRGKARWHDLRHSAISWALLESRMDPVLVSEYAGVSVRTIQRVYLHSTHEKTASVARAIQILPQKR